MRICVESCFHIQISEWNLLSVLFGILGCGRVGAGGLGQFRLGYTRLGHGRSGLGSVRSG